MTVACMSKRLPSTLIATLALIEAYLLSLAEFWHCWKLSHGWWGWLCKWQLDYLQSYIIRSNFIRLTWAISNYTLKKWIDLKHTIGHHVHRFRLTLRLGVYRQHSKMRSLVGFGGGRGRVKLFWTLSSMSFWLFRSWVCQVRQCRWAVASVTRMPGAPLTQRRALSFQISLSPLTGLQRRPATEGLPTPYACCVSGATASIRLMHPHCPL